MSLSKATLLALIGIYYTFILKTVGTFLPDIFKIFIISQTTQILSIFASVTLVVFFISFYKNYVQNEQTGLKKAVILAIIGTSATSLLYLSNLLLHFNRILIFIYGISPYLFTLVESRNVEATGTIVLWVSSIFTIFFFIMFYKEIHKEEIKLKKPALFAIWGSLTGTLLQTIILLNYLFSGEIKWFSDLSSKTAVILFPVSAFSFIAVLYFFSTFYKEQK